MGANARAIETGQFGVDEALLCQFVPMSSLAVAHISQPLPFAGVSELHPIDQIRWREAEKLVSRAFRRALGRTN
jgi:hypothetical protein